MQTFSAACHYQQSELYFGKVLNSNWILDNKVTSSLLLVLTLKAPVYWLNIGRSVRNQTVFDQFKCPPAIFRTGFFVHWIEGSDWNTFLYQSVSATANCAVYQNRFPFTLYQCVKESRGCQLRKCFTLIFLWLEVPLKKAAACHFNWLIVVPKPNG